MADRRTDGPFLVAPVNHDEQPAGAQKPHDLREGLRLVVQMVQHVDHDDPVGHAVGRRHGVGVCLDDLEPLGQLRRKLGAQHLREARQRLDGDHAAVGHGLGHGDGVDARAGAVVDDGLVAVKPQQVDDRGLWQCCEAGQILQAPGVLWVEGVSLQPATVVISNSGG